MLQGYRTARNPPGAVLDTAPKNTSVTQPGLSATIANTNPLTLSPSLQSTLLSTDQTRPYLRYFLKAAAAAF